MKHVTEILPDVMKQIMNPEPKRPDADIEELSKMFNFLLWEPKNGWNLPNEKPGPPVYPQLCKMLQAVWHFAKDQQEKKKPRWLSLLGSSGAGKTYLVRNLYRLFKRSELNKINVIDGVAIGSSWCDWPELAGDLQKNEGRGWLEELEGDSFVVLDEIGADKDKNGHVRDCLARLCSARVGKWTIITSNLFLSQIQQNMDARIASRMLRDGSVVVEVLVPDFNLINNL